MTTQHDEEMAELMDEWCGKLDAALSRLSIEAKAALAGRMGLPLAAMLDDDNGKPHCRSSGAQDADLGFDLGPMPPAQKD